SAWPPPALRLPARVLRSGLFQKWLQLRKRPYSYARPPPNPLEVSKHHGICRARDQKPNATSTAISKEWCRIITFFPRPSRRVLKGLTTLRRVAVCACTIYSHKVSAPILCKGAGAREASQCSGEQG